MTYEELKKKVVEVKRRWVDIKDGDPTANNKTIVCTQLSNRPIEMGEEGLPDDDLECDLCILGYRDSCERGPEIMWKEKT